MRGLGPGLQRWQNSGQNTGSNFGRGSDLEPWPTLEHNPRFDFGLFSEVGHGSRLEPGQGGANIEAQGPTPMACPTLKGSGWVGMGVFMNQSSRDPSPGVPFGAPVRLPTHTQPAVLAPGHAGALEAWTAEGADGTAIQPVQPVLATTHEPASDKAGGGQGDPPTATPTA